MNVHSMAIEGPSAERILELIADRVCERLKRTTAEFGEHETHWDAFLAMDIHGWVDEEGFLDIALEAFVTQELDTLPIALKYYIWCSLDTGHMCISTAASNYENEQELDEEYVIQANMHWESDLLEAVRSKLSVLAERHRSANPD